jgi:hypothetical protein
MQLDCKYYNQLLYSLAELQNAERIPASKIKDWMVKNYEAVNKIRHPYFDPSFKINHSKDSSYAIYCYFHLDVTMIDLEKFYFVARLQKYFVVSIKEFKDCEGRPKRIKRWLYKYFEYYNRWKFFLKSNSSNYGDKEEGREYVFVSSLYGIVIGFEVSAYLEFEEFMFNYKKNCTKFDLWAKYEKWCVRSDMYFFEEKYDS